MDSSFSKEFLIIKIIYFLLVKRFVVHYFLLHYLSPFSLR